MFPAIVMSTAEEIRKKITELPPGKPFTPAIFSTIAERSNIDKTLNRLVSSGFIEKPARGIFVRPEQSRFGSLPVEPLEVAAAKANAPVEIHGAEALRRLGLSTQVPVRPVFYTAGRSKTFEVNGVPVRLQHISAKKLVRTGTMVGMVISALWYLGKEGVTNEVLAVIRSKLSEEEYEQLKASAPSMPGWMSQALLRFDKAYE